MDYSCTEYSELKKLNISKIELADILIINGQIFECNFKIIRCDFIVYYRKLVYDGMPEQYTKKQLYEKFIEQLLKIKK